MIHFNADQQRFRIAEFIVDKGALHTLRQVDSLQHEQLMVELAPENVNILHIIIHPHINDNGAVTGCGRRFFFFDFRILKKILFKFLSDLLFNLQRTGSGIIGNNLPDADLDFSVFAPRHGNQGIHADDKS
jgi:hypothetical protein